MDWMSDAYFIYKRIKKKMKKLKQKKNQKKKKIIYKQSSLHGTITQYPFPEVVRGTNVCAPWAW